MTAEMQALLAAAAAGDRNAEQTLLRQNSGLVWAVVQRYYGRGIEQDELYQLAAIGFIKAVRGFDPAQGYAFSTYAVPKIAGEIRRFLRDDGAIKVSRTLKERAAKIYRVQQEMLRKTGQSPTVQQVAEQCGLTAEQVAAAEQAEVQVDSLDRELAGGGSLADLLGDGGMEERTCLSLALRQAVSELPERERTVLALRFLRDLTQQQAAKVLSVSQVQVSRLERRALNLLRQKLCAD